MSLGLQSETARERELYKYWQPNESIYPSADYDESFNRDYQPRPSYDSALTAYAQLGALRCNAKRGMISVVDRTSQYIIAEGTKTLSLQDGTVTDKDDQLWFGLRTIPRSVGICAMALGQFTTAEAHDGSISDTLFKPLQFIISDLSKDVRFAKQPFVCGAPYLRFYAGVPIRSPAGHIIGIYSIVDDKPRDNFNEHDLNVLKDLAATVMDHLVLGTVRGRHHRADRMVKGLGLFVEGKATLRDWWLQSGHLAKGPTTKDGSRGEWTLKAQADAEFGPEVEITSNNHTPKRQNGFALKSLNVNVLEKESVLSTSVDTVLGSVHGQTPASEPTVPRSPNSHKISQGTSSGELGLTKSATPEHVSEYTASLSTVQTHISSGFARPEDEDSSKKPEAEIFLMSQDVGAMFKRASNLIRESITVEGCLFLDAGPAEFENTSVMPNAEKLESSLSNNDVSSERSIGEDEGITLNNTTNGTGLDRESSYFQPSSTSHESMCKVLGYSSSFNHDIQDGRTKPTFRFPKEFLHRLFQRYPNGSILNFEDGGNISSSEEEVNSNSSSGLVSDECSFKSRSKKTKSYFKELDAKIITDIFPSIRRLAFFPLWDTITKTWFCGGLAWTNDPLRVLDPDDDMAYLAAFGNSIMAEKSRLDVLLADRMKGNFISTVSHELRSPLHGILASAELLKDMTISPAQIDVISTINTCGRTLLDTINHVLDFTELNRLRKSKLSEKKKPSNRDVSKKQNHSALNLANKTADLDLSILIEEVVESTLAGYDFGLSESAAMLSSGAELLSSGLEKIHPVKNVLVRASSRVRVILDVDWQPSWVLAFQPGAWRRIVMNLFGNALKYTKAGYISVSLKSIAHVSNKDSRSVVLTVSDTGKGISKEFLKHHIFTPFLQEDNLATGTGLGLSIVQQIVHDLEGQIDIKSEQGSGTKVTVQVPFRFPALSLSPSYVREDNAGLERVRQKMKGLKVYIASSENLTGSAKDGIPKTSATEAACVLSMKESLRMTLKHWFEVEILEAPSLDSVNADVCLLLEDELSILGTLEANDCLPWKPEIIQLAKSNALIVLSTAPASLSRKVSEMLQPIHFLQLPFGPHKLTRAFNTFLNQREMPLQPLPSQLDLLPTNQLSLDDTVTSFKPPQHTISAVKIEETNINIDLNIDSSSITTTTISNRSPQYPIHSNLPTVLLVEDNEINLKLLIMYMRKFKYPYRIAVNGLQALQIFKKDPLPLRFILMDISMPVMDGLTATREIRKHERELGLPPTTILALTGASSANAQEEAILSGVDKFLTKPVSLNVVKKIIDGWNQQVEEKYI